MNKITKEIRDQLRSPLPKDAITQHPTKTYLSTIKNIYITERLNDVFGLGNWATSYEIISVDKSGMVVVRAKLTLFDYGVTFESFGGNDNGGEGSKNFDLGDAYKGACSDAISKICAIHLEIGIDVYKGKTGVKNYTPQRNNSQDGENKSWYNRFESDKEKILVNIHNGVDTPDSILRKIEEKYKVSNKTKELILNLK